MKLRSYKIFLIMFFTIVYAGCEKLGTDSLIERPPHLLTDENLFTNYDGFQTGLNGLYSLVRDERRSYSGSDAIRIGWAIGGTDIYATNSRHRDPGPSRLNADYGDLINPQDEYISHMFAWLYGIVNTANTIINRAETREDVDWSGGTLTPEGNRNLVIAEAKAIRAWAYRHLTYMWGDVPLVLEPSSGATIRTDWTRDPVVTVYQQIIDDLLFAEQYIPVESSYRGRLTKGAVQHYLTEMFLIIDDPSSALHWADQVIGTPEYQLITERYGVKASEPGVPFMDMFLDGNQNRSQGNTEALWVFQYALNVVGGGVNHMRRHYGIRYGNMRVDGVSPLQFTVERGGRSNSRSTLTNFALGLYKWPETGPVTHSDIINYQDDRISPYAIRWFFILKDAQQNAPFPSDVLPPGYAFGDTIWMEWDEDISPANNINERRPYTRKVDAGADPNDITSGGSYGNWVYLRLGNTYLLKAEAQYKLNDLPGAAETINIIRRRANASEIQASDVNIDFYPG
jgi:starch-binding outer membrane protein, SusD/RagB family